MYKSGQKLVYVGCDKPIDPDGPQLKRGEIYTFSNLFWLFEEYLVLKEIKDWAFRIEAFRPVNPLEACAIADLVKIEIVEERSEVPIRELEEAA